MYKNSRKALEFQKKFKFDQFLFLIPHKLRRPTLKYRLNFLINVRFFHVWARKNS